MFNDFLTSVYYGNTGQEYLVAFAILVGLFVFFRLFNYVIIYRLRKVAKKTKTQWDDFVIDFLEGIHWFFYIYLSLYLASLYLKVPEVVANWRNYILILFLGYYVGKGLAKVIEGFVQRQIQKRKKKHKTGNTSMMKVLGSIGKVIVWTIILLMVLSNFGVEITPLIASIGVGGIAVALALQTILGDLFSAFVIYFDKPFEEGDFIIIGDDMGTIEKIGIKSTRIRALQGQELVVSNTELTNARINNYKQMEKRRVAFEFGVQYNTGSKKLKKAKKIVQDIIKKMKNAELDRVHFKKYGDSALIFEVVYYVDNADYYQYMDIQEELNLKMYEAFEKEGIEFAFPTRTIQFGDNLNFEGFGGLGGKSSGKGSKSLGKKK